jgi:hypothetical protein
VPWLAIAAVGLAGYGLGRWGTAPEVETREVVRTEWRTKVETKEVVRWRDRVVERRVTDRRTEVSDAGTVVVERIEEHSRTDRDGASASEGSTTQALDQTVSRVSTPVRPQWRVGVDVGASLREPLVPLYGPVVVGARVERWIAGPVWLGAWASTSGAAGVSVSGEF